MPFHTSVFQLFALKIYTVLNFSVLLPLCSCQAAFSFYERPTFVVCSGFDTFAIVFCSPVLVHLRKFLVITEF